MKELGTSESESQEGTRCAGKGSSMDLTGGCDGQFLRLRVRSQSVIGWALDSPKFCSVIETPIAL